MALLDGLERWRGTASREEAGSGRGAVWCVEATVGAAAAAWRGRVGEAAACAWSCPGLALRLDSLWFDREWKRVDGMGAKREGKDAAIKKILNLVINLSQAV